MFFQMLVGISGSGKSTYAHYMKNMFLEPTEVVSSDAIRGELYGDESIQGDPNKVFCIMLARTKQFLSEGKSVIYDATNLSDKRRINFLKQIEGFDCPKLCHELIVDPRMCSENQKLRARQVSDEVIYRQVKQFRPPHISEGWDGITMDIYAPEGEKKYLKYFIDKMENFDQHNPHHSLSLNSHLKKAFIESIEYMDDKISAEAAWHDFGKLFTQTFDNDKVAHYYSHENVSAYYYLLFEAESIDFNQASKIYLDKSNDDRYEYLDVAWLIAHHMDFFKDEKYLEKVRARVGYELFAKLKKLHECDLKAH